MEKERERRDRECEEGERDGRGIEKKEIRERGEKENGIKGREMGKE